MPHGEARRRTVVRLKVNLAPTVAAALRETCDAQRVGVTEGMRRAIAVWKLVSDARAQGQRLMLVQGHGADAVFREVVFCE